MKSKDFDSVKMMRDIRDDLSKKFSKMTIQEEMKELQKGLKSFAWLQTNYESTIAKHVNKNYKSKVAEGISNKYKKSKD